MRIYVDSADRAAIADALQRGFVYGVTTNPTLLRRAGVGAAEVPDLAAAALKAGAQEIHLQVYSATVEEMITEGRDLAALDPARVVVKIPATAAGFRAAAALSAAHLRVTLTAVYTVRQTIAAASAGAAYVAIYLGRMGDAGIDGPARVGAMQQALAAQDASLAILAASVRDPAEVETLAALGVAAVTLPPAVLARLIDSPETDAAAAAFTDDAAAIR